MKQQPVISVITVCYNAAETIEETIQSVLEQTYADIEYIIIDGGSTDGTVEIIRKYAGRLAYWVSEPDKGIYDAMNKGIAAATGEYINFMNAGDTFHNEKVVEEVFSRDYPESCSVIYGKTQRSYRWGTYIKTPRQDRLDFCHQSTFIKTAVHKKIPFDLSYKICADHNFFHGLYQANPVCFVYCPVVISDYDCIYGVSSTHIKEHIEEVERLQNKKSSPVKRLKRAIKNIIPVSLLDKLYRIYFGCQPGLTRVK